MWFRLIPSCDCSSRVATLVKKPIGLSVVTSGPAWASRLIKVSQPTMIHGRRGARRAGPNRSNRSPECPRVVATASDVSKNALACQQNKALQFNVLALAFGEAPVMGVAGAAGKLDGFGEVQAD